MDSLERIEMAKDPNPGRQNDPEIDWNVIVMTAAGKPIFWRHGDDQEISRTCALIQALRTTLSDPSLGLGEIQSLRSQSLLLVFCTVGAITLLASARVSSKYGEVETEAFMQLQLEYVYNQLIFTLTEHFQTALQQNPSIDLRESLGSPTENVLKDLLRDASPDTDCGAFLVSGVEPVFPITPDVREHASLVLSSVKDRAKDTAFAILLVGTKLLSLVQPCFKPLCNSDLRLLIHNVNHQPGLKTSELWFPVCLPRFHSSAFLYAYTHCLEAKCGLTLVLISQLNSMEQFQIFRSVAVDVRRRLGLPALRSSVLRVMSSIDDRRSSPARAKGDVPWKRSEDEQDEHIGSDDDSSYVNVNTALEIESLMASMTVADDTLSRDGSSAASGDTILLLQDLHKALDEEILSTMLKTYREIAGASHFLFRLDVQLKQNHRRQKEGVGKLSQCISPPIGEQFHDGPARRRVWAIYQRLQLRLRLGSATSESVAHAYNRLARDSQQDDHVRFCPASLLIEAPPIIQGISYLRHGPDLFFAMNGKEFEIYMVVPSEVLIKDAATSGARLVRALLEDEKKLFLWSPITWKD